MRSKRTYGVLPTLTATRSSSGAGLSGSASRCRASSANTARTVRSGSPGQRRSAARPRHQSSACALRSSRSVKLRAAKNGAADVADAALDAAFLVAARHRDGTGFVAVVPGKAQQRGMEADRVAAPFQHRTLEIVVEQTRAARRPRR